MINSVNLTLNRNVECIICFDMKNKNLIKLNKNGLVFQLILWITCLLFSNCLAKTHEVFVSSNVFFPRDILIEAGDTVRWINTGGSHNVYEVNG